jgi:hypothetical protein
MIDGCKVPGKKCEEHKVLNKWYPLLVKLCLKSDSLLMTFMTGKEWDQYD